MESRRLGRSGLSVPVLCFGTATFGGVGDFFKAWGSTDVAGARRMVDLCLDAGLTMFDTADGYSLGAAEEILGQALEGRRDRALISTKATFPIGNGANAYGSSRQHILAQCDGSLRRLRTDRIDLYYMHGMDLRTPIEETLRLLDDLVSSGKVRYIGCSNFAAWHLMRSLSLSERHGWHRYIAHQAYYSLVGRDVEWELMPLGVDQGVGTVVWSPLAGGALGGRIRRGSPAPRDTRIGQISFVPYETELLHRVVDELDGIARERGKLVPQVALNWLLRKPTVASIVIGARTEEQLRQNLGAVGWSLTAEEVARLDAASAPRVPYPTWHQREFPQLIPTLPGMAQ
jgi:aryl-alcohol dehydrogenase-like predicted oxidoreductase